MRKLIVGLIPLALTAALLTWGTNTVHAQGGSMGGSGASGGSGGAGSTGSFGSLGGTTSTTGNTYSGATGTGGNSNSSNATYGTGAPQSGYYANPLSYGLGGNTALASTSASSSTSSSTSGLGSSGGGGGSSGTSSSASSGGFTSVQAPSTVAFGQALFNVQPVSTFTQPTASTLSSSGGSSGIGGSGGSASIRSSTTTPTVPTPTNRPAYTVFLGFTPDPVPVGQVSNDVQNAVLASSDWTKANNKAVQVGVNGNVVVLRGTVANDHDRELAARLAAMTPGVRDVRNELTVNTATTSTSASSRVASR